MRLIDADATIKTYCKKSCMRKADNPTTPCAVPCEEVQAMLDAPTIPAPRWVRCDEGMPKDGDWVLIWAKGYAVPIQAFHESGAWIDDRFEKYTDVTHWMPLPEPPKEDV